MKLILRDTCILVLTAACLLFAEQKERSCKATFVLGQAEMQKGDNQWRAIRQGQTLSSGSVVRTFVESKLQITTEEGTVITVDEKTLIRLKSLMRDDKTGDQTSELDVRVGKVLANVKKLSSKRSKFVFETPVATAAIRGTELELDVSGEETKVKVFEGVVFVSPLSGAGASVGASEIASVRKGQRQVAVRRMETRELKPEVGTGQIPPPKDPIIAPPDTTKRDTTGKDTAGTSSNQTPDTAKVVGTPDAAGLDLPALPTYVEVNTYVIAGKAAPNGRVKVNGVEVTATGSGSFQHVITLRVGPNAIALETVLNGQVIRKQYSIEYRPPLRLSVANIADGALFTTANLDVAVVVTEGARFSINGMSPGQRSITLRPGPNTILVRAYDRWNRSEEQSFNVVYETQQAAFFLNVVTPANGSITEPRILVSGTTVAGATVLVQGSEITVGASGAFSHTLYMADETADFEIEIRAKKGTAEKVEVRRVTYAKPKIPLSLVVTSPTTGVQIRTAAIPLAGLAKGATEVRANSHALVADMSGRFSGTIPVTEKDIGEYLITVVAGNGAEEVTQELRVNIDAASPEINTSVPRVSFATASPRVTRGTSLALMVVDNTPDEEMILSADVNGEVTQYTEASGGREQVSLSLGKNRYKISAKDRAGNTSNILSGEIVSLPRAPQVILQEPADENYRIEGVPPGTPTGIRAVLPLPIQVEIDDGIGNQPENIRTVRVLGPSGAITLVKQSDYTYSGQAPVRRGSNRLEIMAEDIAGNIGTKVLNVLWQD